MRGSLAQLVAYMGTPGIIPAHAGLTVIRSTFSRSRKDHPRACGAHNGLTTLDSIELGSSPRMRGSLIVDLLKDGTAGIIPAHAGLTG